MKRWSRERLIGRVAMLAALALWFEAQGADHSPPAQSSPPAGIETRLARAGTNRAELIRALDQVPAGQREALLFLLAHMPEPDLQSLSAAFLLEHVRLAGEALEAAPWGKSVPRDIFLNDVLPYACLNERRDAWRGKLRDLCAPLVRDCPTPAAAAQALNQKLFGLVKVRYSTQRKRPDQSPLETMDSGLATCTGLSILLVDACRAVGVPARVVGTPMWVNLRGNHTWVEIWDGDWHFAGAAEPDPKGLDRGWFTHEAAQARADNPKHAIYASSFKPTGLAFPLPWARDVHWVPAANVTERYAAKSSTPGNQLRLLVNVLDRPNGRRVAADVTVRDSQAAETRLEGKSRDESADLNDLLPFEIARERAYELQVQHEGRTVRRDFRPGTNSPEIVLVYLDENSRPAPSAPARFPCPDEQIPRYTAYLATEPLRMDGRLDEPAWQQAARSPRFVDILTGQRVIHDTKAAILWDQDFLYVGFWAEEPFVHAKFTNQNDPIYYDNDLEVFIAGRDAYYEFEMNAFNTTYEVFFIWRDAYETGGFAQAPEFHASKMTPFNGVGFTTHPRGGRLGNFNWHFPGKQTAVHIDGTVNNDADRDRGWTAELAFPWSGMSWLAKTENRALPPQDGDVWRIDLSRFNAYKEAPPARDSGGWFWSPHFVWDSHVPECFPYIRFSTNKVRSLNPAR